MKENASPEEVAAYTAGIVDGEGSITIAKGARRKGGVNIRKSPYYNLMISVDNTNKGIIDWLYTKFGGVTYEYPPRASHHKPRHMWRVHAKSAETFLRVVYPYLIIKRKKAQAALFFRATFDEYRQSSPIDPQVIEEREMWFRRIKGEEEWVITD